MLTLTRTMTTSLATFGELRLGHELIAVTLEDPPGEGKGPIPSGTYRVVLTYSDRFQALLPELLAVPGRTGIRIHAGNTKADTTGCILVGRYRAGMGEIADSRAALAILLRRWPEWHDDSITIEAHV